MMAAANLFRFPCLNRFKEGEMKKETRRGFVAKMGAMAVAAGATRTLAEQTPAAGTAAATGQQGGAPAQGAAGGEARRSSHVHEGIYYISGTGSNDGYPKEDHVTVTDPFEKHVTRTMDALKKSVERAGSSMDNILHLTVFLCLPLADGVTTPTGAARFEAHKAQYQALNKIYGTYFSEGKAPSRACMAVEWIPGDSLIEIVGSAKVITPA
jgi:enamine deaminase RidA (YjgF/YER057c/UK114 family)